VAELLSGVKWKYKSRKKRQMLSVHGQHHPRADTCRLHVPTKGHEQHTTAVKTKAVKAQNGFKVNFA
jgi:hypothetical protein